VALPVQRVERACALVAAQEGDPSYALYAKERDDILGSLKRRAVIMAEALNGMEGVTCSPTEGALYVFPKVGPQDAADRHSRMRLSASPGPGRLQHLKTLGWLGAVGKSQEWSEFFPVACDDGPTDWRTDGRGLWLVVMGDVLGAPFPGITLARFGMGLCHGGGGGDIMLPHWRARLRVRHVLGTLLRRGGGAHRLLDCAPQIVLPKTAVQEALSLGKAPDFMYCKALLQETGIVTVPGSGFKQVGATPCDANARDLTFGILGFWKLF
jgi:hypothetical protein